MELGYRSFVLAPTFLPQTMFLRSLYIVCMGGTAALIPDILHSLLIPFQITGIWIAFQIPTVTDDAVINTPCLAPYGPGCIFFT